MRSIAWMLVALGAFASACRSGDGTQRGREMVPLKLFHVATPSYAPLFVAVEEGFFEEQGLQVDFVGLKRAADGLPALLQGDLDVTGDFVGASYLNAMARGARVRFVADKGYIPTHGCDSVAFVASPAVAARSPSQKASYPKGLRVGANPRSVSGYFASRMFAAAGLPADALDTLDMPRVVMEPAIGRSLDIGLLIEPAVTRATREGRGAVWVPIQQVAPDFQLAIIAFGPSLLDRNPDAGRRFMVAYLKGVRRFNEGKTERNLDILVKYTDEDRALLEQSCWPSFRPEGRINVESIAQFQSWALERKLLDRAVAAEQAWDSRFVDYANQVLDGVGR
jgi:NitT/TauT family transport system substrate-binding protein